MGKSATRVESKYFFSVSVSFCMLPYSHFLLVYLAPKSNRCIIYRCYIVWENKCQADYIKVLVLFRFETRKGLLSSHRLIFFISLFLPIDVSIFNKLNIMYFFQLIPNWLNSCLKKLLLKRVIRKPSQKFPGLFLKKKGLNSPLPKHMARKSKCLLFKSFKK